MGKVYEGKIEKTDGQYAIVVSRFNSSITSGLLEGAVKTLTRHGIKEGQIDTVWVPGAFEIPLATKHLLASGHHVAVLCLGAVIRGETTHNQYINQAVSHSLMELGLQHRIPVLFGLLTCETLEQAIARSGGRAGTQGKDTDDRQIGNKGSECALAALEMVHLMNDLHY